MTGTSSEWSEDAPGADILDLDRYMRGTRPARRPQRNISNSGLVVDAGAAGRLPSSSASSATELSDKRFSHDSGLSDTSYRHVSHQRRHHRAESVDSKTCIEPAKRRPSKGGGEAPKRRGKSGSEAARRRKSGSATARRRKSSSEAARRSSESSRSFRESLERALRDQQAQIARVAQLCELQAQLSERRSERHIDQRSERRKERRERPSERGSEARKRDDRPSERVSEARKRRNGRGSGERSSSESTEFSSSSSSVDPLKRRTSECRTYKIIMSKLDELNRLFVARRPGALPGAIHRVAPGTLAPAARAHGDSSVTVSDKVVGTDSPQHTARQKQLESERNRTIIVATAAVDIPPTPRNNVVTESVVRDDREISAPASEKAMPGRFHLDDPVRLYQQAKRLETRAARRSDSSSPGSRDSGRSSASKGSDGSKRSSGSQGSNGLKGSTKGSASLCALCRCYWLVARRYVAQLSPLRE